MTTELKSDFDAWISDKSFPCLGAKVAVNRGTCEVRAYPSLGASASSVEELADDLSSFVTRNKPLPSNYATLAALDPSYSGATELEFEGYLWSVLSNLAQHDESPWDEACSTDPREKSFKFCFGGAAFYVVGIHPLASRSARRFKTAGLIFNPAWQFDLLRSADKLDFMIDRIRYRDIALQGDINPNLQFEHIHSDALQYAGNAVDSSWVCPFSPPDSFEGN